MRVRNGHNLRIGVFFWTALSLWLWGVSLSACLASRYAAARIETSEPVSLFVSASLPRSFLDNFLNSGFSADGWDVNSPHHHLQSAPFRRNSSRQIIRRTGPVFRRTLAEEYTVPPSQILSISPILNLIFVTPVPHPLSCPGFGSLCSARAPPAFS